MVRKFSIPHSSAIPVDEYLNLVSNYKDSIDNIFTGLPEITNHMSYDINSQLDEATIKLRGEREHEFLLKSKGLYKRLITINQLHYPMSDSDLFKFIDNTLYQYIEKYEIDGIILTHLPLAIKLRNDFPNIELHTSCNCYQWTIRQMEQWRNYAGINVFNPPREIGRMPKLLKEMHDAGFKLKVLVNEACAFGCAFSINHGSALSSRTNCNIDCCNGTLINALRSNLVLPSWLKELDEYVSIYKISGRWSSLKALEQTFDAYIQQKGGYYLHEFTAMSGYNPIARLADMGIFIPESLIPNKVKYCECKECDKSCFQCRDALLKIIT